MTKKSTSKQSASQIFFLPELDLNWNQASVEELKFKAGCIEMLVTVPKGDSKSTVVKLRFEMLHKADEVCYEFWGIISKAFPKNGFAPKAKFSWLNSKRLTSGNFDWEVEIALAPLRKPFSFRCKRIVALSKQGKPLTGANSVAKKSWSKKDYSDFLKLLGEQITTEKYNDLYDSLSPELQVKTSATDLRMQFEALKRIPDLPIKSKKGSPKPKVKTELHWHERSGTTIPEPSQTLAPDSLRAFATLEFEPSFLIDVIVISSNNQLKIGKYTLHRQW